MVTSVRLGDILPACRLERLGGGAGISIGPNRRYAQVLVVTHADPCQECAAYVRSFADVAQQVQVEKGDVVAVAGRGWSGDSGFPVPVAVDDGVVGPRLSPGGTPTVAVADRFGQLFVLFDAGDHHGFPTHDDILTTLLNIAIRCPECGVPDVPSSMTMPEAGTSSGGMRLGG